MRSMLDFLLSQWSINCSWSLSEIEERGTRDVGNDTGERAQQAATERGPVKQLMVHVSHRWHIFTIWCNQANSSLDSRA